MNFSFVTSVILSTFVLSTSAFAAAVPGKAAPAFEVSDAVNKIHKLADYAGKWVVLEWFNKDCPYVKKHYGSGNMQSLQKTYTSKGVVWLTVISSAEGKQGYQEGSEAKKYAAEQKSNTSAILIDSKGVMGKAYGAKTTPHMFVIDPKGQVVFAGGIDDNDSSDPAVISKSKNFVVAALDSAMAGKKVEVSSAKPYGCAVKY